VALFLQTTTVGTTACCTTWIISVCLSGCDAYSNKLPNLAPWYWILYALHIYKIYMQIFFNTHKIMLQNEKKKKIMYSCTGVVHIQIFWWSLSGILPLLFLPAAAFLAKCLSISLCFLGNTLPLLCMNKFAY
jgi:hypothetical protein